eukprot:TRINITY_DN21010_c0_g1_i1.p1 TRINITY_DN21010_c0_g1~~TRINITY_DN21010_c0_g1_i1.p1  ORF type:complete len:182 (-),score=32.18 TRINITY_DN21010_c0_g1_i1:1064-1531(-)
MVAFAVLCLMSVADAEQPDQVEVPTDEDSMLHVTRDNPLGMEGSNASEFDWFATADAADLLQVYPKVGSNSSSQPKLQASKKKKKKKRKDSASQQNHGTSWLSNDDKLTPFGACVWFLGGAMIGCFVLLLALKPPRLFRKKKAKPDPVESCTSGA